MERVEHGEPKIGIVGPSKEVDFTNPETIAKTKEVIGRNNIDFFAAYHHTLLPDKLGKDMLPPRVGESRYEASTPFPDPMTVLAQVAQGTRCEVFTSVLVAPQMSTGYLAQQAATLANLSLGRLNLGVGVGWNNKEYEALGQDFSKRGERLNNQIPALRKLWEGKPVNFSVDKENFENVVLNPKPRYSIPIWVGGLSSKALKRAAGMGDGWLPLGEPEEIVKSLTKLKDLLTRNGRDIDSFPVMGRIAIGKKPREEWKRMFLTLKDAGISHIALTTTGQKQMRIEEHERLIQMFLEDIYGLVDPFTDLYLDLSLVFRDGVGDMGFVLEHRPDTLFHKVAQKNPGSIQSVLVDFLSSNIESTKWSNFEDLERALSEWPTYARNRGFEYIRDSFKTITVKKDGSVISLTDGLPGKVFLGTMRFE